MVSKRQQLTLFVSDPMRSIEKIRSAFNPEQFRLIAAHVTLCREDEISPIGKIVQNLKNIKIDCPLNIKFSGGERFAGGTGLLMRAKHSEAFQALRRNILRGSAELIRRHDPHITLMHPRNSSCTDEIFDEIASYELPMELNFEEVSLIEQTNGEPWRLIEKYRICD